MFKPFTELATYLRAHVVGVPAGAPVPDAVFAVGRLPADSVAKIAAILPAFSASNAEVHVSGRALKHADEGHGVVLAKVAPHLRDIIRTDAEFLKNPKRPNSVFLVHALDERRSALIVLEIAKEGDGTAIVNIFSARPRELRKYRTALDGAIPTGGRSYTPHSIRDIPGSAVCDEFSGFRRNLMRSLIEALPLDKWATFDAAGHEVDAAAGRTDASPAPDAAESGDYPKGRIMFSGLPVVIENAAGGFREGAGRAGPWRQRMIAHYGYFAGTRGNDGDEVDCFIGPMPDAPMAYVVNQAFGDKFDEHKVCIGFPTEATARAAYLNSYTPGWPGLASIVAITIPELRAWLRSGDKSRPLAAASLGQPAMIRTTWDSAANPIGTDLNKLLYQMRFDDAAEGMLLEPMTVEELDAAFGPSHAVAFDGIVTTKIALDRKMAALMRVMDAGADASVKPTGYVVSDPKLRKIVGPTATVNIDVLFTLADGQTVTVAFHNPDTTPTKLLPTDTLISWRWLLNKRDVTILVSPERGTEVNVREVGRRIMKLAAKNATAFAKAIVSKGERDTAIATLEQQSASLDIEIVKLDSDIATATATLADLKANPPQPVPEPTPEPVADDLNAPMSDVGDQVGSIMRALSTLGWEWNNVAGDAAQATLSIRFPERAGDLSDGTRTTTALQSQSDGRYIELSLGWDTPHSQRISESPTPMAFAERFDKVARAVMAREDAPPAAVVPAIDPTTPEGYAAIVGDDDALLRNQDTLDALFQGRLIDVRNALRALGWTGEQMDRTLTVDRDGSHSVDFTMRKVGAGGNLAGVTWRVDGGAFELADDLTLTPEAIAAQLDATVPVPVAVVAEPVVAEAPQAGPAALPPIKTVGPLSDISLRPVEELNDIDGAWMDAVSGADTPDAKLYDGAQALAMAIFQSQTPGMLAFAAAFRDRATYGPMRDFTWNDAVARVQRIAAGLVGSLQAIKPIDEAYDPKELDDINLWLRVVNEGIDLTQRPLIRAMMVVQDALFSEPDALGITGVSTKTYAALVGERDRAFAAMDRATQVVEVQKEETAQAEYRPFSAAALKMPTAVQLGLNKPGVPVLFVVGGIGGWSNRNMLDIAGRPKLVSDAIVKYFGDASSDGVRKIDEEKIMAIVMGAKARSQNPVEPIAFHDYQITNQVNGKAVKGDVTGIVLADTNDSTSVQLDARYVAYFIKTYKGAQFFAGTPDAPVLVKQAGAIMGVIMPINSDAEATLRRARSAKATAPAALTEQERAIATVDAAYRFEDATAEFKARLADSVNKADYSMFATAKEMDVAAKAFGASIAWGVNSTLDAVDGEPADPNLTASMDREQDATQGHVFAVASDADDDAEDAAIDDENQITLFDAVPWHMQSDGSGWIGVVRKDGAVVGRVDVAPDGKGMVFVGPAGGERAKAGSMYGDDAGRMVAALFAQAAEPVAEPTPDLSHLRALQMRLSNEEARLAAAPPGQKAARQQAVDIVKKEIAGEYKFLGIDPSADSAPSDDDDALLSALGADMPGTLAEPVAEPAAVEPAVVPNADDAEIERRYAEARKAGVLINVAKINKTAPANAAVMSTLRHFIGKSQLKAVNEGMRGEEADFFQKKMLELFAMVGSMPRVYGQDGKGDDAAVYLHYFKGGSDWYITERDTSAEQQQAFGFAILNGDAEFAELGYISIEELTRLNVELDFHFEPRSLGKVKASHGIGASETDGESEPAGQENEGMTNADQNVDSARAEDLAFLNSIIAGTADLMADDLADRMEAAYIRHPDDAEIETAMLAAADAYQAFIVNAASAAIGK